MMLKAPFPNLTKLLVLEPNNANPYNYRGNANIERGSLEDAIKDYSKAIEINPDYDLAFYNRGLVCTNLGKVSEAISDFEKAAQLFQDKGQLDSYKDAKTRLTELRSK